MLMMPKKCDCVRELTSPTRVFFQKRFQQENASLQPFEQMLLIVPKSYPARIREEMPHGASTIYQFGDCQTTISVEVPHGGVEGRLLKRVVISAYSIIDWVAHAQILNV
jgi:hypothetical protein